MKVKNMDSRPIWVGNVSIEPGEVKIIDEGYNLSGLRLKILSDEKLDHTEPEPYDRKEVEKIIPLPGAEEEIAEALIRMFGSYEGVKQASKKQLEEVAGIGPKRANKLYNAMRGE